MTSTRPRRITPPHDQTVPLVVYDGDCRFCAFWVERWRRMTGNRFRWEPLQSAASRFPEIPPAAFGEALQLIEPDGTVHSGADAVFYILSASRRWRWLGWIVGKVPGLLAVARAVYGWIARHRTAVSTVNRALFGRNPAPSTFAFSRRIFAHGMGLVFLSAFASLAVQVRGLIGSQGIVPAAELLRAASAQLGSDAPARLPTIFWLGSSDTMLLGACLAGVALSAVMACGICPGLCALLLWALYLSLNVVGSPFMNFQWDALLLEAALPAALFLPWALRPRWSVIAPVATLGRWLLCWLLFRLMFESGLVKLASNDPTWRDLSAMSYHYETQPLPLWTARFAHQAPLWFHKAEAFATFLIEFLAPLAIVLPRRLRHGGAWGMIALMGGIMATGNYAFFNLLTIVLCLPLLDDTHWPPRWRERWLRGEATCAGRRWPLALLAPAAAIAVLLTALPLFHTLGRVRWPEPVAWLDAITPRAVAFPNWVESLHVALSPLRSFNSYGLFAVMTTGRPEIVVEGSVDGRRWETYEFRWKPGSVHERPRLVAPHQPRLDWQMWFAALGSPEENVWFVRFLRRLLEGSPEVLALLEWNPFPEQPPRYVRALLYDYHFTRFGEGPAWWRRELKGLYYPAVALPPDPRAE